jgi:hypothetical protein
MAKATIALTVLVAAVNAASAAHALECTAPEYDRARSRIQLLFGMGILQNLPDHGLGVYVNDAYWARMTFPQKQNFAEELACAAAGVGKSLSMMTYKSLASGKVIGDWSLGTLTVP